MANAMYKIISLNSNKVLDVNGGSLQNGAQIIQHDWWGGPNQIWFFDRQGTINLSRDIQHPDSPDFEVYKIRSLSSNKVLDVNGASLADGTPVIQQDWWGGANQLWYFCPIDNAGTFLLKSVLSTKVLDVNGASKGNGAILIEQAEHRGPNQRWRREQVQFP